ncbi:rod shape-determining protein MreC [Nocardioides sp. Root190]|nr:rod shape-determining protein MreC [Nocardioides sp. Root190]
MRRDGDDPGGRPPRALVVALVLACASLMVLDKAGGESSPIEPVRQVIGEVVGPIQAGVAAVVRPVADLPGALRTNDALRDDITALEDENSRLRALADNNGYDAARLEQLDGLRRVAGDIGYALLPARVIAIGSAQTFSSTVTLDAGSDDGLHADMTVVAADGLVGRITSVTAHTATVLLIVDETSAVGGRIGDSLELGFVRGHGTLGSDDRLEMELADRNVVPKVGQQIVTWGSDNGVPYLAGVPIGKVAKVYESLRETTYRAVITPAVDFTRLDLVGVAIPSGSSSRAIEADGSVIVP